jgi:DNA-binding SARP family transcriptional activator
MHSWEVRLFGNLSIQYNQTEWSRLEGCKVQELFCYLLLHRGVPHLREVLATLLWGESTTAQSKKNLRQALWHLHTYCETMPDKSQWLITSVDDVQFNPSVQVVLDVEQFEQSYKLMQKKRELDEETFHIVHSAVDLYQGDLLIGWYQDWCLYERERLQNMYLTMLDKLSLTCEVSQQYEQGIAYCQRILQLDRARERTHRQIMRLLFLQGDRTAALRQYEKCVASLREELSVLPMKNTQLLYEQICAGELSQSEMPVALLNQTTTLSEALTQLEQMRKILATLQEQVQQNIQSIESAIILNPGTMGSAKNIFH